MSFHLVNNQSQSAHPEAPVMLNVNTNAHASDSSHGFVVSIIRYGTSSLSLSTGLSEVRLIRSDVEIPPFDSRILLHGRVKY